MYFSPSVSNKINQLESNWLPVTSPVLPLLNASFTFKFSLIITRQILFTWSYRKPNVLYANTWSIICDLTSAVMSFTNLGFTSCIILLAGSTAFTVIGPSPVVESIAVPDPVTLITFTHLYEEAPFLVASLVSSPLPIK